MVAVNMSVSQIAHIDKNPLTKSNRFDKNLKKENQVIKKYSD